MAAAEEEEEAAEAEAEAEVVIRYLMSSSCLPLATPSTTCYSLTG